MSIFYFAIIKNKKERIVEIKKKDHNLNHFLNHIIKKQLPNTNKSYQYKDEFTFHTIYPDPPYMYLCISLNNLNQ
jgi:hypothetical protein